MEPPTKHRSRRRWQPMRRLALGLHDLGISSEVIAIIGMILGILAGFSFMGTGENTNANIFWGIGLACCLLRIECIRIDNIL
ncbi:MAG: hypothetical protein AAGC68_06885, partial [Verrucomicrobiota bacterium]